MCSIRLCRTPPGESLTTQEAHASGVALTRGAEQGNDRSLDPEHESERRLSKDGLWTAIQSA